MPEPTDPLERELARLLTLIVEARANGNIGLAEMLTEAAAKCLVQFADAKAAGAPPASPEPEQLVAQQQQQIQSDNDDEPKT